MDDHVMAMMHGLLCWRNCLWTRQYLVLVAFVVPYDAIVALKEIFFFVFHTLKNLKL